MLVLHECKTRRTLIGRLRVKIAAETISALMAMVKRLAPALRGSITFDNGGEFARHTLLRNMLSAKKYFCDAMPLAEGRRGKYQRTDQTLAAKVRRPRSGQRLRHPGDRYDPELNTAEMPRLQNTHQGHARRAWK